MCLAQGPQRNDAGEARTHWFSVSSQALYHWATALPSQLFPSVCFFEENLQGNYIGLLLKDLQVWWVGQVLQKVYHLHIGNILQPSSAAITQYCKIDKRVKMALDHSPEFLALKALLLSIVEWSTIQATLVEVNIRNMEYQRFIWFVCLLELILYVPSTTFQL